MEVIETSCTPRTSSTHRIRAFVTAAVAASALAIPAVSTFAVTAHSAAGKGGGSVSVGRGGGVTPDSHRLASGTDKPASLRLT